MMFRNIVRVSLILVMLASCSSGMKKPDVTDTIAAKIGNDYTVIESESVVSWSESPLKLLHLQYDDKGYEELEERFSNTEFDLFGTHYLNNLENTFGELDEYEVVTKVMNGEYEKFYYLDNGDVGEYYFILPDNQLVVLSY